MTCGVHLGILLICLVQAEHVRCLWATEAQTSQRQNGNSYVGFSQQDSGLGRFSGSYPQNELRQALAQSSSFNVQTALNSGHNKGLSNSGYTQTLSQPAQSGSPSVRYMQSSLHSKPNWRAAKSNQVNAQKVPKKPSFGLSTNIASGSTLTKHGQKQNDLTDISKKGTWPFQQGTPSASKYPSSGSASVHSPPSKGKSAAQRVPSVAAQTSTNFGQRSYSPRTSSSLSSAGAPAPIQMRTSATAKARRVSPRSRSKAPQPRSFSAPQNNPSKTEAGSRYQSKLFPGSGGSSKSSKASNHVSYRKSLPASNKQNSWVNFQPRSPERLRYKPSYPSTEQIPSSANSLQASWNSRSPAQGAHNLPASGSSGAGTSGKRYAPTETHHIPEQFGGFAIRRLKEPADEKEASEGKPQQTYKPPSQQTYKPYKPPSQQTYEPYKPPSQQTYKPPSQQTYKPPSQQTYKPPSQETYKPYTPPSQQTYTPPSQQAYKLPSQQRASLQPQVQGVHPQSKWMKIRPSGTLKSPSGVVGSF